MTKAKTGRKVYTVVGIVAYECEDVLGIYTSKDAAIRAAKKIAKRPVDYYAEYTNYDSVYVYAASLNTAMNGLGDTVWNDKGMKRSRKVKESSRPVGQYAVNQPFYK